MKRYYVLWLYAVTLTALAAASVQTLLEEKRLAADARARMTSVATGSEETILANYHAKKLGQIASLVDKLRAQQGLIGLSICAFDADTQLVNSKTLAFPRGSGWESVCRSPRASLAARATVPDQGTSWSAAQSKLLVQYSAFLLESPAHVADSRQETLVMILAQDLSYVRANWRDAFLRSFIITWFLGFALMLLFALQIRSWVKAQVKIMHHSLRSLIAGRRPPTLGLFPKDVAPDLAPLTRDLDKLHTKMLSLSAGERAPRSTANQNEPMWLSRLKGVMQGRKLTVIANREPYIHVRKGDKIEIIRPASGLVTALEPILRQCGGLWIAHGSGSADRDVVDNNNEVDLPPAYPRYKLRRLWLTAEEENGYYYGFSNEGLWPLCHLAHNRPIFRLSDWDHYKRVNHKFSEAIPESSMGEDSLILIQDYHFAMLPREVRERAHGKNFPKIAIFWHIPWPNPEAFGICPWNEELLRGMLGADLIAFHTQYHCNNFLEACNRYLEARIDYEHFTVTMENHVTQIRAVPIGIDTSQVRFLADAEKEQLKAKYGIKAKWVAVGVDRLDYTKGLIERVNGVERFLEKNSQYVGQFSLVQMGSPSRSQIPAYRFLTEQLEEAVQRVNDRFGEKGPGDSPYQPIVYLHSHHEWDEIQYFYQLGDVCMVTSLHDGMNLVAKEYVWCQRPDRGSLILSKFTGASRELTDAFIVNPYSTEELADSLAAALALSSEEKFRRMTSMREKVRARSAYHWASDLIQTLVKKDERSVVIQLPERDLSSKSPSARALDLSAEPLAFEAEDTTPTRAGESSRASTTVGRKAPGAGF